MRIYLDDNENSTAYFRSVIINEITLATSLKIKLVRNSYYKQKIHSQLL